MLRYEVTVTTEQSFMSDNHAPSCDQSMMLENFAAELTSAVYRIALRQGIDGSWVRVELALWKAVGKTVRTWASECPPAESSGQFKVWRKGLFMDLTNSAFSIAVKYGMTGSELEMVGLYQAFRSAVKRVGQQVCPSRYRE
jgi:hypothetical protein